MYPTERNSLFSAKSFREPAMSENNGPTLRSISLFEAKNVKSACFVGPVVNVKSTYTDVKALEAKSCKNFFGSVD